MPVGSLRAVSRGRRARGRPRSRRAPAASSAHGSRRPRLDRPGRRHRPGRRRRLRPRPRRSFDDLDDPDGLLSAGRPSNGHATAAGVQTVTAELLDDEELDLLGDGDPGVDGELDPIATGRRLTPATERGRVGRAAGEPGGPRGSLRGRWLAAATVLMAAVLSSVARRRPRDTPRPRRRAALLIVMAIVAGTSLIGSPAMAQTFDCKESPEPDRPGTGLVGSLDPPAWKPWRDRKRLPRGRLRRAGLAQLRPRVRG